MFAIYCTCKIWSPVGENPEPQYKYSDLIIAEELMLEVVLAEWWVEGMSKDRTSELVGIVVDSPSFLYTNFSISNILCRLKYFITNIDWKFNLARFLKYLFSPLTLNLLFLNAGASPTDLRWIRTDWLFLSATSTPSKFW